MDISKYSSLQTDEDGVEDTVPGQQLRSRSRHSALVQTLCVTLLVSLIVNVLSCGRLFLNSLSRLDKTPIAGLTWNTPATIQYSSPFNDPNRTAEDEAWASSLVDPAVMVVALDDSYTESMGVSHSMRWPWNAHKGVYTLNSAHELHCLHLLRKTVNEAYDGAELSWPRGHSAHCLEYLLQNIMCYADDTLLYQGLIHQNKHAKVPIGGLGDTRTCRDWSQLQSWASEHSACYNPYAGEDDPEFPEIDRYKYCPDGHKPWEEM